jgi:hypothetical protein
MNVTKKHKTYRAFEFTGENRDEIRMALTHTAWYTRQFVPDILEIVKGNDLSSRQKVKAMLMGYYLVVSSKGKVWVGSPSEFQEDWDIEVEGDED